MVVSRTIYEINVYTGIKVSREAFLAFSFNQHSAQNIRVTLHKVYIFLKLSVCRFQISFISMKSYRRRKSGWLSEKWEALRTEFTVPRVVVNRSNSSSHVHLQKGVSRFLFSAPLTCYEFLKVDPRKKSTAL